MLEDGQSGNADYGEAEDPCESGNLRVAPGQDFPAGRFSEEAASAPDVVHGTFRVSRGFFCISFSFSTRPTARCRRPGRRSGGGRSRSRGCPGQVRDSCSLGEGEEKGSGRDSGSSRATGRAGGGRCGAVRDGPGEAVVARAPLEPGRAGKRRAARRKPSVVTEVVGEEKKGRERKGRRDGTGRPSVRAAPLRERRRAAPCGAGADPAAALGVWPCLLSALPNLHVKCASSFAQDNGLPNAISGLLVFYLLVFRW